MEREGVGAPACAAFGDLMAGEHSAFMLVAAALTSQVDLTDQIEGRTATAADRPRLPLGA